MNIPIEYKIKELERLEAAIDKKKESIRIELSHSFTALLKLKKITQREAADILNISHGTVAAMCNNRPINKPSLKSTLTAFRIISEIIEGETTE